MYHDILHHNHQNNYFRNRQYKYLNNFLYIVIYNKLYKYLNRCHCMTVASL